MSLGLGSLEAMRIWETIGPYTLIYVGFPLDGLLFLCTELNQNTSINLFLKENFLLLSYL